MNRLSVLVLGLILVTSAGCQPSEKAPELPVITDASEAIAKIGDLEVTGQDLHKEILSALQPNPRRFRPNVEPVEADAILLQLIGDRALVLDARQQGLLNEGSAPDRIKRYRLKLLVNALAKTVVPTMPEVSDEEMTEFIKENPKATAQDAKAKLANNKAAAIMEEFYQDLVKTRNYKVNSPNCAMGAKVYERLQKKPVKERKQFWVQNYQFDEEVTDQEKALVLAEWDGGKFTLTDFFDALSQVAPPGRPKDLVTGKGFESFLARMIRRPVMQTEALSRGLDKQPEVAADMRAYEDRVLMSAARSRINEKVVEPSEEDLKAYYNLTIGQADLMTRMKVDEIWCKTRDEAQKARVALDEGKDFNEVQATYTLAEKPRPQTETPQSMGLDWSALQGAQVGDVVGPVFGHFNRGPAWRVMRVVEVEERDYPGLNKVKSSIQEEIHEARRDELMNQKRAELLAEMPYEILTAQPEVFDPRYIPETP